MNYVQQLAGQDSPASLESDIDRAISALWPTAYRIAWLILRNKMSAEDVAQESCIRALQHRSQLRDPSAMVPWFRSLVSKLALSTRRKMLRRQYIEISEVSVQEDCSHDGFRNLDLADAIDRLGDNLRIPLVLFYYGGFSSDEIGRCLGSPSGTIRYKISVARDRLRPILEVLRNDQ
jgi:RNA polymerase sigma-70 factor (ECF subfamily)